MQTSLSLLALLLSLTLALVAPADCGCRVDLHGGSALHPVFAHPHPEAPPEGDGLASVPSGQPGLRAALALDPVGPAVVAGEVLPRPIDLTRAGQLVGWLARSDETEPSELGSPPPDPPPQLA